MKKPENIEENRSRCICPNCPLFTPCNGRKKEKFFCGNAPTACPMDAKKMCICGGCQIYKENNLTGGYFCINEIK